MTTPTDNKETAKRGPFYEATRMILLAGIGAVSLAQDEINNFLDRLVERGEMAEADARNLVREMADRREKLEIERQQHIAQAKRNSKVATQADIDALNARIAELNHKIEELREQQS